MFKFLSGLVLAGAVLGSVFSVGAAESVQTDKKILQVGCEGGFAPFTYINDDGKLVGFDIDIIQEIGKALGYEVNITVYPFDGLIPALLTDNIDLIISGFTISEERAKRVDFSDPYYLCGLTFLINEENDKKYKTFKDLDGTNVCVQIGTSGAMFVEKALPKAILKQFNSPAETYLELQNHGCSAVINDTPVNDFFLAKSQDKTILSKKVMTENKEYYGIAVNKNHKELLAQINKGLKLVHENGSFATVSNKWFGYDITESLNQ